MDWQESRKLNKNINKKCLLYQYRDLFAQQVNVGGILLKISVQFYTMSTYRYMYENKDTCTCMYIYNRVYSYTHRYQQHFFCLVNYFVSHLYKPHTRHLTCYTINKTSVKLVNPSRAQHHWR